MQLVSIHGCCSKKVRTGILRFNNKNTSLGGYYSGIFIIKFDVIVNTYLLMVHEMVDDDLKSKRSLRDEPVSLIFTQHTG